MKKSKGFTLIELLAVLVIIAIIALIITPIVTGVIKDSRIKASENALNGLLTAIDVYYGKRMMANDGKFNDYDSVVIQFGSDYAASNYTLSAGGDMINTSGLTGSYTYNAVANQSGVINGGNKDLVEYKGTEVTAGMIVVDRNGVQTVVKPIRINNYYCTNKPSVKCQESASGL